MRTRAIALTLLTASALGAAVAGIAAQTPAAAASSTVQPSIAFVGTAAAVALRTNGDVVTWGVGDTECVLGRQTSALTVADHTPTVVMHNAKEIAANRRGVAVLTREGKVYTWSSPIPNPSGYKPCDGPVLVSSLDGIVVAHIRLGLDFAVAVSDAGDVYCAGSNDGCPAKLTRNPDSSYRGGSPDGVATFTRLALPGVSGNALDVRTGTAHTLVLTKDHKLYAFGRSRLGELGDARFTPTGALVGFTPEPVLTNVASFAAGQSYSVVAKDDGTVWTWGHNAQHSALCDGTTTDRRVPTQLASAPGQVVQVAAFEGSTLMRTKDGALYACGNDANGQLGLGTASDSARWTPVTQPTRVPGVAVGSSVVVMGERYAAFSPDGCALHIAGVERAGAGIRGAGQRVDPQFTARAGVSLCAAPSAASVPDIADAALRRPAALEPGIDCWMPRWEVGLKNPKVAALVPALAKVEQIVAANQAFMSQMPERVRMEVQSNGEDGTLGLLVNAYPRQFGQSPYWTSAGCNIIPTSTLSRAYEHPLGSVTVNFNRRGLWRGDYFNQSGLKPVRVVAGFPIFEYRFSGNGLRAELMLITKDGRLPIVPVTLADRLDQEAGFLAKRLDDINGALAGKPDAAVEAIQRTNMAQVQRQVGALRAYRASFSADQLRAAWVRHDGEPQSPEWRQMEAQVKALEALSPADQVHVNEIGVRVRTLQLQARTRGTAPEEAARLRQEANELLNRANAISAAQRTRVEDQVQTLRDNFRLKLIRPGDASQANEFKEDPTFFDSTDPSRIQLIIVDFDSRDSRATTAEQAKAWMDVVEATFDYQALKALID